MSSMLKFLILLVPIFFTCCVSIVPIKDVPHEGYGLKVWIDGKRTYPIDVPVYQGLNFFQHVSGPGLWKIDNTVSGNPVFEYAIDKDKLGLFVEAKATFEKLKENEAGISEPFYSNLSGYTSDFQPGYSVMAENFQTAESDDVIAELPSGKYLVRLFVNGSKEWDSQTIFINIE